MKKIINIICLDNIKSRVVICYFLLLAVISWTSLLLQDNEAKGALTILNITLFIVPLMSLLYTVTYLYDSRAFIVLLLSQPVQRRQVWKSLYAGTAGSLLLAYLVGAGIPILLYSSTVTGLVLLLTGCVLTLIFVSAAFLTATLSVDKTRGIGAAILLWLLFTMIYDAVLLYLLFAMSEWPVEKPLMALMMLNPVDLARFQVIMQLDAYAMMGYSGAAFKEFLGATAGIVVSAVLLLLWVVVPYVLSLHVFRKKDL